MRRRGFGAIYWGWGAFVTGVGAVVCAWTDRWLVVPLALCALASSVAAWRAFRRGVF